MPIREWRFLEEQTTSLSPGSGSWRSWSVVILSKCKKMPHRPVLENIIWHAFSWEIDDWCWLSRSLYVRTLRGELVLCQVDLASWLIHTECYAERRMQNAIVAHNLSSCKKQITTWRLLSSPPSSLRRLHSPPPKMLARARLFLNLLSPRRSEPKCQYVILCQVI